MIRAFLAGVLAASTLLWAGVAGAQATQSNIALRDASGAIQATCSFTTGGAQFPCHLVYGKDGSGNLQAILTDSAGRPIVNVNGTVQLAGGNSVAVKVDNSGVVQPISASALPLPANAAQETGGHLATVDTSTASTATNTGRIPAQGQAAMAASTPVVIASNQSAVPVSGTFWQATQPVSAASLPLPSNAAQESGHLATVDTSTASTATNTSTTATNTGSAATDLGPPGATACATDTGSCSLNALMQRLAQRLTTLNTTLGTPFQAGASIGNTSFAATEGGTWTVQPGNTANTTPWLFTMSQGGNTATVTAGNALKVDGSAVTQPVSAAALPLPSGAATAANQTSVQAAAGSSSSSALGVQGVSGGVAVKVDGSAVTQPVSGAVTANPATSSSTNNSGTIVTGGAFQTLLASNSSRKGCFIQNPRTATEDLYVSAAIATGSATVAKSYDLGPGDTFSCFNGLVVMTDNIAVEAATTGHAFVETDQ